MLRETRLVVLAAGFVAWTGVASAAERTAERKRETFVRRVGAGAHLGVSLREVARDDVGRLKLEQESGALVAHVAEDSAAEKAGLKAGDVIVRYQGEAVRSARQLSRMVRETPAGRTVELEVSREGAVQKLRATMAEGGGHRIFPGGDFHFELPDIDIPEPPEPPEPPMPPALLHEDGDRPHPPRMMRDVLRFRGPRKLGLAYQDLTDQLARYFKVEGGVLVTRVEDDGPAGQAGIKAGDVIVKFGGEALKDGGDLRAALDRAAPGTEVEVVAQRDGRTVDLEVKIAPAPGRHAPGRTP